MNEPIYILYIDRYHQDDSLFLQALARTLTRAGGARPAFVLVHGSGELAERRLEAEGYEVQRVEGMLDVRSTHEVEIVERAMRESNQKIVSVLTDNMVHAVGLQGIDRGLVQLREDGSVWAPKGEWVRELAGKGVVPVISALVRDMSALVRQADPAAVAAALAAAFGAERSFVVFFAKGGFTVARGGGEVTLSALPGEDVLPEPGAVRRAVEQGSTVLIGNAGGFLTGKEVAGTRVVA